MVNLRPLYMIAELLVASHFSQPQPAEAREWVDAPAVGGQVYSTLGEHWLKKGRKCRSTVIDWTGYLSDPYGAGHDFVAYGKNYNGYLYIDV